MLHQVPQQPPHPEATAVLQQRQLQKQRSVGKWWINFLGLNKKTRKQKLFVRKARREPRGKGKAPLAGAASATIVQGCRLQ